MPGGRGWFQLAKPASFPMTSAGKEKEGQGQHDQYRQRDLAHCKTGQQSDNGGNGYDVLEQVSDFGLHRSVHRQVNGQHSPIPSS